ncbi:DUF881 domain-containing protein [Actinotalea sp. JY-7885]|uniref:DUF881 domain-containing protein n=1 Tax=Actinotalea sp. JY-7885 TaxID=2758576 RepID=UPI00165D50E8|nr:DUF881 domain-containing protein [Actinotalea sp. JY-7885]
MSERGKHAHDDADPAPETDHAGDRTGGRAPWGGAVAVSLVLVMAGFLFAANARLAGGPDGRQPQDLAGLVEVESARLGEIEAEVRDLEAEVGLLTDAQVGDLPMLDPTTAELEALAAGLQPVEGPGLTVRLSDAPANVPRPDDVTNDDLVVHQQDLQAVINGLWAGGAEAMTLQGQRVVATSAFRCVGNVLLLHGRTYSPPFVVRAVGDPDELRASLLQSPAIQEYLQWVDAVGLGWSTTVEGDLELPAYEGSADLQYADVPDGVDVFAAGSAS